MFLQREVASCLVHARGGKVVGVLRCFELLSKCHSVFALDDVLARASQPQHQQGSLEFQKRTKNSIKRTKKFQSQVEQGVPRHAFAFVSGASGSEFVTCPYE